jgi:glycosyltransferase involved in cell wall biosynthesis
LRPAHPPGPAAQHGPAPASRPWSELPDLRGLRIAVVNPYLEGRQRDCEAKLLPRSHLWGADALAAAGARIEYFDTGHRTWERMTRALSRRLRWRFGNLDVDLRMLRRARDFDLIYVANGVLLLTQLARHLGLIRAPLALWTYTAPEPGPAWRLQRLWARSPFIEGVDAFLCLTASAEAACRARYRRARARFIPWGADSAMFPGSAHAGEFFFACGRTNRDYRTLIEAARRCDARLVILASRALLEGIALPPNVEVVAGPRAADTDKGIGYAELIDRYYARARAVLICRKDIPGDTSGLTNLLEALAMSRPVAITRTGTLDLDVEQEGVGRFVAPGDVEGWARVMHDWARESASLAAMRERARALVERQWNHLHHGAEVARFLAEIHEAARSPQSPATPSATRAPGAASPR